MSDSNKNEDLEAKAGATESDDKDTQEESVEELRADIEATRASMSETIDAIQDKLDPQHIKEEVKEKIHDATIDKVQNLAHAVGEKLAPAADQVSKVTEKLGSHGEPSANDSQKSSASLKKLVRDNPLHTGLAVLAILLVAGASIMASRQGKSKVSRHFSF
jgi:uncharacterized membrane protein